MEEKPTLFSTKIFTSRKLSISDFGG